MRGGRRQDAERADRPERRSPLLRDVSILRRRGRKARDRRRRKGRGAWSGFLATPRGGTRLLPLPFFFPSRRVSEAVMPWLLSTAKLVPAVAGSRSLPGETHVPLCPLQRLLSEKPEAPQRDPSWSQAIAGSADPSAGVSKPSVRSSDFFFTCHSWKRVGPVFSLPVRCSGKLK